MCDPRRAVTFVVALVCALAVAATAHAFSGGITTLSFDENGLGCGECHAGGSVPEVTVTGPTSVAPDSTNEYTVTVEDIGSQDHAGFNVSALLGVLATGGANATNT